MKSRPHSRPYCREVRKERFNPMATVPKISVVTPCFNMAGYIESTVRSILDQDYPNLEYIVVDGGSTDGTLGIVQKHADRIARIISEPDDGQYDAVQKGFAAASGEILAWLNADDVYYPWTLQLVGQIFAEFPNVHWVTGLYSWINKAGQCVRMSSAVPVYPGRYIRNGWFRQEAAGYLQQENMFWRRDLWDKSGGLDLRLRYAADYQLWTEFARHADLVSVAAPLAAFRLRPGEQRSSSQEARYRDEVRRVCAELPRPPLLWRLIARRGLVPRMFCRLAAWKKGPVIAYSHERGRWELRTMRRPLSRLSLSGLLLEEALRRPGH